MTDEELKSQFDSIRGRFESMDKRFEARFDAMFNLITSLKESLEGEIRSVGDRMGRMSARLDKIAAGAH